MFPVSASGSIPSTHLRNMIFGRQFSEFEPSISIGTNGQDLFLAQFAHTVPLAAIVVNILASFRSGVLCIFAKCTKEKVFWINALRSITRVQNAFSFGYFPKMYFPRNAMSLFVYAIGDAHGSIGIPAGTMQATNPKPAGICLINFLPKSILQRSALLRSGLITTLAAIFPAGISGGLKIAIAD